MRRCSLTATLAFMCAVTLLLLQAAALGLACDKQPIPPDFIEWTNVSNNVGRSEDPSLVVDSAGTAHLSWTDDTRSIERGGRFFTDIMYARHPLHGKWSDPVCLSDPDSGARLSCLAIGPGRTLHAAWQQDIGGRWVILYVRADSAGSWSVAETIASNENFVGPGLAVDAAGGVHLCWMYGGYHSGIRYAYRSPDGQWSSPVSVVDPSRVVLVVHAAAFPDGSFVLGWSDCPSPETTGTRLFCRVRSAGGVWGAVETVSGTGHVQYVFSVAALADSRAAFVWRDYPEMPGIVKVLMRQRLPGGVWLDALPVTDSSGLKFDPLAAVGDDGNVTIAGYDSTAVDDTFARSQRLVLVTRSLDGGSELRRPVGRLPAWLPAWQFGGNERGGYHIVTIDYKSDSTGQSNDDILWIGTRPPD